MCGAEGQHRIPDDFGFRNGVQAPFEVIVIMVSVVKIRKSTIGKFALRSQAS